MLGPLLLLAAACGGGGTLILATTTSTENSGLLDDLVPAFEEQSGISVKVIAVGSGAALAMGERGDVDVLLVHSPDAVDAFVASGFGVERARVMFNDFIIVGPPSDPAGVTGTSDAAAAVRAIAQAGARFVSRGDDSGTHAKEKLLWAAAGLDVPRGAEWYVETGQGMGATLTVAAATGGYVLTDRATYLVVADGSELPLLVSGDTRLRNIYDVVVVNPERHGHTNIDAAREFRAYLLSAETQERIDRFGRERFGQSLFTGDAE
jgi:tungstate transport system substrate-binding protein